MPWPILCEPQGFAGMTSRVLKISSMSQLVKELLKASGPVIRDLTSLGVNSVIARLKVASVHCGIPPGESVRRLVRMASKQNWSLTDLDDGCLVNIFGRLDPLPHLFGVSAVCKRFRSLSSDGRLWLRVGGEGNQYRSAKGHRQTAHQSLHSAIQCSRPGDTIVVSPGVRYVSSQLAVSWPLKIIGAGRTPEETHFIGAAFDLAAVAFRASAILANISISSERSACIEHHGGKVVVESCCLHSTGTPGLEHLFTPIATLAASPGPKRARKEDRSLRDLRLQYQKSIGGCLSVKQTKIKGPEGMRAVSTLGSGMLSCVRVIHLAAQNLFWFEVDSDRPSLQRDLAALNSPELRSKAAIPAWALSNKPLFPSAQMTDEGESRLAEDSDRNREPADNTSDIAKRLSRKAKHWQQRY